jgi:predicted enzyme related to lactoylglutathione lyase
MTIAFSHANLWVHDQDEALAFYTERVGLELRDDITLPELGGYRWLTVGPPGQPDVAFILSTPGPPVTDKEQTKQLLDLVAKGVVSGIHFRTDDCEGMVKELKDRGVDFSQEPTEMPYGIDAEFTDPSGNRSRLTQLTD